MWNKIYSGLATFGVYYALLIAILVSIFVAMGGWNLLKMKEDVVCLNDDNTLGGPQYGSKVCYTKCKALLFLVFMLVVVWGLYYLTIKFKPFAFVRGGLGVYDLGALVF